MDNFKNPSNLQGKSLWEKIIAATLNLCLNVSFPQAVEPTSISTWPFFEQVFHKFERVIHSLTGNCGVSSGYPESYQKLNLSENKTGTGPKTDASFEIRARALSSLNLVTSC